MRILIVTAGSHGDVNPFLAIAQALGARGHRAVLMTNPAFEPDARAAGVEFQGHGEAIDIPTFIRRHDIMHATRGPRNVFRWIFEHTPGLLREFEEAIDRHRPDVVLHHVICFGVPWVCARRGLAHATACLQPAVWFSRGDPVPAMQREARASDARAARVAMRALGPLGVAMASWKMNRLRLACGFPKQAGAIARDFRGGDLNLGLWSPAFRPPAPGDPATSRITGFPMFDGGTRHPMPERLARFLDDGEPPVVFARGTTAVHVASEFYRFAADACGRLGIRGVLLCGPNEPPRVPRGVIAVPYAPFGALLPRAAASVIHGGIGSVAQALAAGRPTLVAPVSHDQFNNGVRIHALGVGLTLGRAPLTLERLEQGVATVLNDSAMQRRASGLGRIVASEQGAEVAAAALESLVLTGARSRTRAVAEGSGAPNQQNKSEC